jgi:hypothetical protein
MGGGKYSRSRKRSGSSKRKIRYMIKKLLEENGYRVLDEGCEAFITEFKYAFYGWSICF